MDDNPSIQVSETYGAGITSGVPRITRTLALSLYYVVSLNALDRRCTLDDSGPSGALIEQSTQSGLARPLE